jgi:hypothetical protein
MQQAVRVGVEVACFVIVAASACAQVDDQTYRLRRGITDDRFALALGGFLTQFDSESRLDSEHLGEGTDIDLEETLGMDDEKGVFRLDGYYRFSRRSRLQFGYTGWSRGGERRLTEEVQWGDRVYEVGALVTTEMNSRILKLAYKYSVVNDGRVDAGASLGLSTYWFFNTLDLAAGVSGGGGAVSGATQRESRDIVAPIPTLGLHLEWTIAPRFFLRTTGEYFSARVSGYDGELLDLMGGIDYYVTPSVGLGVAYNFVNIDFLGGDRVEYRVRYEYDGLFGYLRFSI